MKSRSVPRLFADVTARLEDLHAIAVDGQCRDNALEMQQVLNAHLRSGLAALDDNMRQIAKVLEGSRP